MAYNLSALITELQTKAKDSSLDSSLLTQFINDAQETVLGQQEYSFMEKSVDTTLAIGQTTASYPTDHQKSIDLVLIDPVIPTQVTSLEYLPYEAFFNAYPNPAALSNTTPTVWTDYGHTIYFNAPADKAYTFRHRYLRIPTTLVNGTDVPDVPQPFRLVLINYAMGSIEEYRDNFAFASAYGVKAENAAEDMAIRMATRQSGAPNVIQNTMGYDGNVKSF